MTTSTSDHAAPVLPYIGPVDSLRRFVDGEVVTFEQFVTDQSLFTVEPMHPARLDRFKRMLEYTRPRDGNRD